MKFKIKSEFVGDDYERIYFNDLVVFEGHSVTARQLMDCIYRYTELATVEFTKIKEEDYENL